MDLISPPVPLQEIIEFLQQLVSVPSVESEQVIAPCIAQKLTELGFESHLIGDPEHPSVICHHQAATATKTIWLQSHLDTAPVGDRAQWQHNPFAETIVGDCIYGRGVALSNWAIAQFESALLHQICQCQRCKYFGSGTNFKQGVSIHWAGICLIPMTIGNDAIASPFPKGVIATSINDPYDTNTLFFLFDALF